MGRTSLRRAHWPSGYNATSRSRSWICSSSLATRTAHPRGCTGRSPGGRVQVSGRTTSPTGRRVSRRARHRSRPPVGCGPGRVATRSRIWRVDQVPTQCVVAAARDRVDQAQLVAAPPLVLSFVIAAIGQLTSGRSSAQRTRSRSWSSGTCRSSRTSSCGKCRPTRSAYQARSGSTGISDAVGKCPDLPRRLPRWPTHEESYR